MVEIASADLNKRIGKEYCATDKAVPPTPRYLTRFSFLLKLMFYGGWRILLCKVENWHYWLLTLMNTVFYGKADRQSCALEITCAADKRL